MNYEKLELPADFSGEVRLFPLPATVLFPRSVLPLHIFESRYREMFEDAIDADNLIAMATLLPGYEDEYYSRPQIAPAVCIGHIHMHERTEDGRYNFVLVGLRRAEVQYEIEPVRAYRRAMVKLLDDGADHDNASSGDASLAEQLLKRVQQHVAGTEQLADQLQRLSLSLATFTDVLAFHLPLETSTKLQLLAESDPTVRAGLLMSALPNPNGDSSDTGSSFPPRFSGN